MAVIICNCHSRFDYGGQQRMKKQKMSLLRRYSTLWVTIGLLALYELATKVGWLDTFLFPSIETLIKMVPDYAGTLVENLIGSFSLLIPGLAIAAALGIALGVSMGLGRELHRTMNPIFNAISPLPATLLTPYAIHIFESFRSASIFIIAFGSFWPIFNATMNGVMTIDKRYLDKAFVIELTWWRKLTKVVLPAAAPTILSGMITAMRSSFILLVVAEMYGVNSGMGYFVQRYSTMGSFNQTALGFVVLSLALVLFLQIFEQIKKRVLHWTID